MGLVAKAFQDIITFSRASAGTYVNSNGYITNSSVLNYLTYSNQADNAAWTKSNSFVQTNLLTFSEDFASAGWAKNNSTVTSNAAIAPDGTLTADKVVSNVGVFGTVSQAPTVVVATTYTYSVDAKAAEFSWLRFQVNLITGTRVAWFNLASGAVGTVQAGLTASIVSAGNGFYRCIVTAVADNTNGTFLPGATNADNSNTNGDGVSGVYIWGAQLVQGSVPGNYQATTSAALPVLYADYQGVVRARKLCEAATTSAHFAYAGNPGAGLYVLSEYFKAGERTRVALGNSFAGDYAVFDLSAGTVASAGSGTVSGGAIINLGNGWYRCSAICAPTGTWNPAVVTVATGTTTSYTGDGSSGIYIADAQLNEGSTALAYYDTTASAYNAPRFDYDPVTLAAKGLLIEESRANLLLQSNDWSATWINSNITRTAGAALGPDGQMSMTKLEATTSTNTTCRQQVTATATSHTFSVYVKQGSGATQANLFAVYNNTTTTDIATLNFNYSTGVVSQSVGTGATATNVGNGIWRIVVPVTSGIAIGNLITVYPCFSGAVETAGEFAYVYGAQLEAGAFATSYMPTTGSQFTRAADVASVNTLSPWFNAAAGTLYGEADIYNNASITVTQLASISDGTSSNLHRLISYNGKIGGTTSVSGSTVSDLQPLTYTTNTTFKFAYAYAANDFAAVGNGGAPLTDAAGALPTGLNLLGIGYVPSGVFWSGHIRRITYYPRRLTNAELQTLTTL